MTEKLIKLRPENSDTDVEIALPAPKAGFPSFFAWSLNKAGSTLLTRMLDDYFSAISYPRIDVPGLLFRNGLPSNIGAEQYRKTLFSEGYAYIGWRNPAALRAKGFPFDKVKNILLVRDPRDRLVSSYFSVAHSHSIPDSGGLRNTMSAERQKAKQLGNVNEWVRSEPKEFHNFLAGLNGFHKNLPPNSTRIYRYEDIIFRKKDFLADVIEYSGATYDPALIDKVAEKHDIRPSKERPEHHVRQVKFGNYKEHFDEESMARTAEKYAACLDVYGFNDEQTFGDKIVFAKEGKEAKAVLSRELL